MFLGSSHFASFNNKMPSFYLKLCQKFFYYKGKG